MDVDARLTAAEQAHREGRLEAAEAGYREILASAPHARAAYDLGILLSARFEFAPALEQLELADRLAPDWAANLAALGGVLVRLHRAQDAEAMLRRSLALKPDQPLARQRLGWALLMQARYAEGWPYWDSRPVEQRAALEKLRFPQWRGEPLAGKSILVWGEQGIGDQIQAARFIPQLRALGARVTVVCLPHNVRIFEQLGAERVIAAEGDVAFPDHDYWSLIWSLPGPLGVTYETLAAPPYLTPPPAAHRGGIAVSWRGSPNNANDAHRSMPDDWLLRLVPGAVELQPAGDSLDSLAQVAAFDLVITVDTAWAHMAGAIGKPCWLLLSHSGVDWRWFPEGPTSPWYPSVRLFWQAHPHDWDGVTAQVQAALA